MPTQQIEWADGSGDKIYITSPDFSGNQQIAVSSDPNTGAARSKVVTFSAGNVSKTLTVEQAAGQMQPVFYTYLIFDGKAYIDTDIVLSNNDTVRVGLGNETQKKAQKIFLAGNIGAVLSSSTNSTNRFFTIYYGKSSYVSSGQRLAWTYESYSFYLTPKRYGWGNAGYGFTKGSTAPTSPLVLGSNNAHDGLPYTGKMRQIRLYGSDAQDITKDSDLNSYTPYATLRPCTYNGVPGLWHVEQNKFYGNSAGVGSLSVSN